MIIDVLTTWMTEIVTTKNPYLNTHTNTNLFSVLKSQTASHTLSVKKWRIAYWNLRHIISNVPILFYHMSCTYKTKQINLVHIRISKISILKYIIYILANLYGHTIYYSLSKYLSYNFKFLDLLALMHQSWFLFRKNNELYWWN